MNGSSLSFLVFLVKWTIAVFSALNVILILRSLSKLIVAIKQNELIASLGSGYAILQGTLVYPSAAELAKGCS